MTKKLRIVHCLNQFFGGMGGEEAAGIEPHWFEGAKGPGQLFENLSPDVKVIGTVVVGDNYMAENVGERAAQLVTFIKQQLDLDHMPDLVVAGPAFNAGRYGLWCAALCQVIEEELEIPSLTAVYPENPAVESYRQSVCMVKSTSDVMGMQSAVKGMLNVGRKLATGVELSPPEDGTIPRGIRQNYLAAETGAKRAVGMLLRKLEGCDGETEYPMPTFDRVAPAPAIPDLSKAMVALVTSGGIVPRGNPDRIEAASASTFGEYPLKEFSTLSSDSHQSVHGGYDPTYANEDPNRILPLDVLRELVVEGRVGRLLEIYYATVGNATSVKRAQRFGKDIAAKIVNEGALAVILTST